MIQVLGQTRCASLAESAWAASLSVKESSSRCQRHSANVSLSLSRGLTEPEFCGTAARASLPGSD